MHGIHRCSGSCLYCSAASTMNYNEDGNKNTFKFDREKTKKRVLEYTEVEKEKEKGNQVSLHIDLWGGNPLENFNEFKQVVEFCENDLKDFYYIDLHTSGNGLELRDNEKVQYLIDHNIYYQLSHDGCGQFIRTGVIDPLYWDKTKDNIIKLARLGLLNWINCTLNGRNYSFFENMNYFNKWRRDNDLMEATKDMYIKLNNILEGTPSITKKWLFDDYKTEYKCVIPPKKGEEIGDLNIAGKALNTFMHELKMMGLICMMPGIEDSLEWRPFVSYISNFLSNFNCYKDEELSGACRKFQLGLTDKNFAIDTIGEYCQCNLIDSSCTVKKPNQIHPKECETCEYKDFSGCKGCGSEVLDRCEFHKEYARTCQEFEQIRMLLDKYKESGMFSEPCSCEKNNKEPVFCVKNYNL